MTLCPIALAVSCKKCPVFAVCPAKRIIGDYKSEVPDNEKPKVDRAKSGSKKSR